VGGIGASVLATAIVSFAGPSGEEAYQRFLSLGVTNFYSSRNQVPNGDWVRRLCDAKHRCILLGQAHGNWLEDPGFQPALVDRLRNGVHVEMFFLDPGGKAVQLRQQEDSIGIRDTKTRIRKSLRAIWKIRSELEPTLKEQLRIYVYDATPSLGVTWIDSVMLVTHYLAGSSNLTSPALVVEPRPVSDTPYATYDQNVSRIRASSFTHEVTADNIGGYTHEGTDEHTG
jgi:hypothetical protein